MKNVIPDDGYDWEWGTLEFPILRAIGVRDEGVSATLAAVRAVPAASTYVIYRSIRRLIDAGYIDGDYFPDTKYGDENPSYMFGIIRDLTTLGLQVAKIW